MDNETEYLTIEQFAEKVGTSKQNIYRMTKGRLAPYMVTIKSRFYISAAAIEKYYSDTPQTIESNPNQSTETTESNANQPQNNPNQSTENNTNRQNTTGLNTDSAVIDSLNNVIELLRKELAAKDSQIAELHTLLSQQQKLQLLTQEQNKKLLEDTQVAEIEQETQPQPPKHKSIFDFFKKS